MTFKVLVATALLAAVASTVEWRKFVDTASGLEPAWLIPVVIIMGIDRLWMAGKWWYLLHGLGVPVRYLDSLFHYHLGGIVGAASQWSLGGDIVRAVGLGAKVGQRMVVAASVVLEKLAGLAASGLLATLSVLLLASQLKLGEWERPLLAVGLLSSAAALAVLPVLSRRATKTVVRIAAAFPWRRLETGVAQVAQATTLLHGKPTALIFFLLTLGNQLVPILVIYLLQEAFGFNLDLIQIVSVFPVILLLSRLPIFDSLGVREALFVFLFALVGLSTEAAFVLALAARLMTLFVLALGTVICLALKRHNAHTGFIPGVSRSRVTD